MDDFNTSSLLSFYIYFCATFVCISYMMQAKKTSTLCYINSIIYEETDSSYISFHCFFVCLSECETLRMQGTLKLLCSSKVFIILTEQNLHDLLIHLPDVCNVGSQELLTCFLINSQILLNLLIHMDCIGFFSCLLFVAVCFFFLSLFIMYQWPSLHHLQKSNVLLINHEDISLHPSAAS